MRQKFKKEHALNKKTGEKRHVSKYYHMMNNIIGNFLRFEERFANK